MSKASKIHRYEFVFYCFNSETKELQFEVTYTTKPVTHARAKELLEKSRTEQGSEFCWSMRKLRATK